MKDIKWGNKAGASAGVVVYGPEELVVEYILKLDSQFQTIGPNIKP